MFGFRKRLVLTKDQIKATLQRWKDLDKEAEAAERKWFDDCWALIAKLKAAAEAQRAFVPAPTDADYPGEPELVETCVYDHARKDWFPIMVERR